MQVASLGRAVLDGLSAGGVAGVIKHMPGHGRACVDSHCQMPVVAASTEELETDLAPFRSLAWAPIGMTAHILYPAWDAERPATLSPTIIAEVIRGRIGFDGLLMSDDLQMAALTGGLQERAQAALGAGCDLVLHCSGELADTRALAEGLDAISDAASARLDKAMTEPFHQLDLADLDDLIAKRDSLLAV
jgi:beta-N-acetylhexosaminidase